MVVPVLKEKRAPHGTGWVGRRCLLFNRCNNTPKGTPRKIPGAGRFEIPVGCGRASIFFLMLFCLSSYRFDTSLQKQNRMLRRKIRLRAGTHAQIFIFIHS